VYNTSTTCAKYTLLGPTQPLRVPTFLELSRRGVILDELGDSKFGLNQ